MRVISYTSNGNRLPPNGKILALKEDDARVIAQPPRNYFADTHLTHQTKDRINLICVVYNKGIERAWYITNQEDLEQMLDDKEPLTRTWLQWSKGSFLDRPANPNFP